MAKPYTINITNGSGTENILSGAYNVTSDIAGYDNTSIKPTSITIDKSTITYNFTVSATGELIMHVTEDGTELGTPVVGATFIRCDQFENEYGTTITTDAQGIATLSNLPYSQENPPTIYYKQKTSDGEHEYDGTLKNINLSTSSSTIEVINEPPLVRIINLSEENYEGYDVQAGTITLS